MTTDSLGEIEIPREIEEQLEHLPDLRRGKRWAEWEDEALRRWVGKKRVVDIARILERSVSSVYNRVGQLGLRSR